MLWIRWTDNTYNTLATDNSTVVTDFTDWWTNFHKWGKKELKVFTLNEEWYYNSHSLFFYHGDRLSSGVVWIVLWSVGVWFAEGDTTSRQIIWRQLDRHRISWDEADEVLLHFSTDVGTDNHVRESFWKLYLEYGSRKRLEHFPFNFDFIIFWHWACSIRKNSSLSIYKWAMNANDFWKKKKFPL